MYIDSESGVGIFFGASPLNSELSIFFVQVSLIICISHFLSIPFRKLHQPVVIAEIIAGIVMGPSVLGLIPRFTATIFSDDSVRFLKLVADMGLNIYLFLVGLRLDVFSLLKTARQYFTISLAGIIIPSALGVVTALCIYPLTSPELDNFRFPLVTFALYLTVTFNITALPVLAHIITDSSLITTTVGNIAMSAAIVDDAVAWILLALVVPLIYTNELQKGLLVFMAIIGFAILLFLLVRPIYIRILSFIEHSDSPSLHHLTMALTFILIFISSWITEMMGAHAIFGAFLVGIIIPPDNKAAFQFCERLENFILILFLPLNFTLSGLRTDLRVLGNPRSLLIFGIVFVLSSFGKLVGGTFASKVTGLTWRESIAVGTLMNTKGLLELIVLNIGLDLGVITVDLFTVMLLASLLTTFLATPIVNYVYPPFIRSYNVRHDKSNERSTECNNEANSFSIVLGISSLEELTLCGPLLGLFRRRHDEENVILHFIRFKETIEWTSNVLLATQQSSYLKADEVFHMVQVFCQLFGILLHHQVSFGNYGNLKATTIETALIEKPNLLLFPFNDTTYPNEVENDILEILQKSCTTGVFYFNKGLQTLCFDPTRKGHVFLPFFKGNSDREALFLASNIAMRHPLEFDVFYFHDSETPVTSFSSSNSNLPLKSLDSLTDDELMDYFESIDSPHASRFNILHIYGTKDYEKSIESAFSTNDYDLVICGCSHQKNRRLIDDIGQFVINNLSRVGILLVNGEYKSIDTKQPLNEVIS